MRSPAACCLEYTLDELHPHLQGIGEDVVTSQKIGSGHGDVPAATRAKDVQLPVKVWGGAVSPLGDCTSPRCR